MLDSHSQLAIPPETGFLSLAPKLRGRRGKLRERFFNAVVNYPQPTPNWPDFEIPAESFWSALTLIEPFTIEEGFRQFYRLYAARFDKPYCGDKTPLYCRELNSIRRVLPEARFIHIIRDGRDAALSLRRMWFSPSQDIETLAAYWSKNIRSARRAGLGRPDYLEVRYEDLILNTQRVLERICEFLDLVFEDSMLTYYTRAPERLGEHKGRTRANGSLLLTKTQRLDQQKRTTRPPDPACAFSWKALMTVEEKNRFGRVANDLLEELGYET